MWPSFPNGPRPAGTHTTEPMPATTVEIASPVAGFQIVWRARLRGRHVDGTANGASPRAEISQRHYACHAGAGGEHPCRGVHRVLPARRRAGRVHEQPTHRPVHHGGCMDLRPVVGFRRHARVDHLESGRARARLRPRRYPRRTLRVQRGTRRVGAGDLPGTSVGRRHYRVDHPDQRVVLGADGRARGHVPRIVGSASVHTGLQHLHSAVPDHGTTDRVRTSRATDRARGTCGQRSGCADRLAGDRAGGREHRCSGCPERRIPWPRTARSSSTASSAAF